MQGNQQLSETTATQQRSLLSAGTIIRGRHNKAYIVERVLGQGGFSSVYLVRDHFSGQRRFALKELDMPEPQKQSHPTFEAEILMRLHHPSLPHIYEAFEDTSCRHTYLLMDYIAGKDLETLRKEQPHKRYPLILVIVLMNPIVEAISYLHAQTPPIVHRDIKPANIIVPDTGRDAFLVDFGLAKEYIQDKTTNILRCGTPGYAALEQYGQGTSLQTDLYGLAATIYTLLTGTIPPAAIMRSLRKQADDPLKRTSQLNPAIPTAIDKVLSRALSLQPEQRYASVDDFWQEFTTVAEIYAMGGDKTMISPSQTITAPLPTPKQPATPFPSQPVTPFPAQTAIMSSTTLESSPSRSRRPASLIMAWGTFILVVLSIAMGSLSWLMPRLHNTPSSQPGRHLASVAHTNNCLSSHSRIPGTTHQQTSACSSPTSSTPSTTSSPTPAPAHSSPFTIYPTPAPVISSTPTPTNNSPSTTSPIVAPATPTPSNLATAIPTPTPSASTSSTSSHVATPTPHVATPTPPNSSKTSSNNHSSSTISIQLPQLP